MLESGCVSVKNEVNIMMKNIVDIVLGGCKFVILDEKKSWFAILNNSFDRQLLIGSSVMACHLDADH